MCGRFALDAPVKRIVQKYFLIEYDSDFQPNTNIAPGSAIPVIFGVDNKRILKTAKWGFTDYASFPKTKIIQFNSRMETLRSDNRPTGLSKNLRCLIPASGFYEWKKIEIAGKSKPFKKPYFFNISDSDIFGFAGIYRLNYKNQNSPECSIITAPANNIIADIHCRMPVIIQDKYISDWLNPVSDSEILFQIINDSDNQKLICSEYSQKKEPDLFSS
ncbi:MAG TPA: SOS response-associated peptidase [bacterium]|nr:SOS response-associated peptidase [bacterium]